MRQTTSARASARERLNDDQPSRQAMLTRHLGLVYHVARQMARSTSVDAEMEELVSAGMLGLIDALENFDESRGLAFSTYAAPRIRGSILDDLRRQDRVPRSVRRRNREVAAVTESLARALGRDPHPEEVARTLDIDIGTLWRWQADGACAHHVSLDQAAIGHDSENPRVPAEFLVGSTGTEIDDELTQRQEATLLREAILQLGDQERVVLSLHYFEELKLCEVARILGVSESRVSQIRAKAITHLRGKLDGLRAA